MAYPADTNWRWDPSGGSNNNGGGFAASKGGARITSPVTYTDLVIDAADNTKISSAGERAFTATDAGNVINVQSGTGWTVQRAMINSVTAGVATMDRAMGTVGSTGGTGVLGGACAVITDALLELTIAGNTHELWATATMTIGAAISVSYVSAGTSAAPVKFTGMASDGSANPTGDNRPLIAAGAYNVTLASYWNVSDVRVTTTGSTGLSNGSSNTFVNCKAYNSSTTPKRSALTGGGSSGAISCECQSDYGYGLSGILFFQHCYSHDCSNGASARAFSPAANNLVMISCIADTSVVGVYVGSSYGLVIENCTFYACKTNVSANAASGCRVVNNIFAGSAGTEDGAIWNVASPVDYWDYNDFYNLNHDRTNVAAGAHDFDADPLFTDAANGDFSRTETDADGIGITLGVG